MDLPTRLPPTESREGRAGDLRTAPIVELALRLGALGLLLYVAVVLIQPFVEVAIWSIVLAVALYPVYERLAHWLGGRRRLAAALLTIVSLLVIIGPATWLALGLVDSLRAISADFDVSALTLPAPPAIVKTWPLIGQPIYQFWELASTNLSEALKTIAPHLKPLGGIL